MTYDYIIIGGGPTGLTLAWCLSKYGKKIAIIDKNKTLGGCHRVHRLNGLFSEHGPRMNTNNKILIKILKEMDINFYDIFKKYKFNFMTILKQIFNNISIRELYIIAYKLLKMDKLDKNITLFEFMENKNFNNDSKMFINSICRLMDCADSSTMLLYNFLYNLNIMIINQGYQPKYPNDKSLFYKWKKALIKQDVDIFLNTEIYEMNNNNKYIINIICTNNLILTGKTFIFAIPPINIAQFLNSSKNIEIKNSFGYINKFTKWASNTNYLTYIPIIFHWNINIDLSNYIIGFPFTKTSWIIIFNVLSDYISFDDNRSKTVISCTISQHGISETINKKPNDCSKEELIKETFNQLKTVFKDLPPPTHSILSQNVFIGGKWESLDTAFSNTKYKFLDSKSVLFNNLYNCGTQNMIEFTNTRMTSAMYSAIQLLHKLIPVSINEYSINNNDLLINNIFIYLIFIIIFIFLIQKYFNL